MIIFDLEANGLPHNVTTIHCLVLYDTKENTTVAYNDEGGDGEPITRAITLMEEADRLPTHSASTHLLRQSDTHEGTYKKRS